MPEGSHEFHGANHRPLLKKSIHVQVSKNGGEALFILESIGVGHHLPSGDLFRHLTLDLFVDNQWTEVAYIGRTFALQWEDDRAYKRLASDTALRPGEKRAYRTKWKSGTK